jgi:hypothetical protein
MSFGIGSGLGLEHAQEGLFWNALVQARVGACFLLSPPQRLTRTPVFVFGTSPRYERNPIKTLLDVGLASDVDSRFSDKAFYAIQLVVKVAFVEEFNVHVRTTDPRETP